MRQETRAGGEQEQAAASAPVCGGLGSAPQRVAVLRMAMERT